MLGIYGPSRVYRVYPTDTWPMQVNRLKEMTEGGGTSEPEYHVNLQETIRKTAGLFTAAISSRNTDVIRYVVKLIKSQDLGTSRASVLHNFNSSLDRRMPAAGGLSSALPPSSVDLVSEDTSC